MYAPTAIHNAHDKRRAVYTTLVYKNGFVLPTNVIVCKSLSSSFNPPRRFLGTNAGLTDVEEREEEEELFFKEVMVTSLT
mmetsp:Transcript_6618/g.9643  ORF Transcript_6618/g.9643 Transcript_6618/m.9643 type:complete len:80 (-) Transcript_6618:417-656(-)